MDQISRSTDSFDFEREYPMNHKRRGKALIFSHFQFSNPKTKKRKGNEIDKRRLREELTKLSFEVQICQDYTKNGVLKKLEKVAKEDHSGADCLAVVVMSHGRESKKNDPGTQKKSKISAWDVCYEDSKLFEIFKGTKCPSLLGKPKLFFIQACRGKKREKLNAQWEAHQRVIKEREQHGIPDNADFLIVRSSFNGTVSFRNKKKGSIFIQTLCDELKKNYKKKNMDDLNTILTFVNKKVSSKGKQMSNVFSTLTKLVYFRKKDHESDEESGSYETEFDFDSD